jgi:hypothetical protein
VDVWKRRIRGSSKGHNFPKQDPVRPPKNEDFNFEQQYQTSALHVRFFRIDLVQEGLGCHPFNWNSTVALLPIVIVVHRPGHSKVRNLDRLSVTNQHIPGGDIPVDKLK